jgi:hypothetical protein
METRSQVFDGAPHEDLLLMGLPPVNLLLTGRDGVVRNVLEMLLRDADEPITRWFPGEQLVLPHDRWAGTIVLHDVDALDYAAQLQLLDWLEQDVGRTQVVSTTSGPLMPRVEAGTFNDILYYRLNTVSVQVTAPAAPHLQKRD